jgi:hypothetical protein
MTRIVLDSGMREKLHNLTEPLELCDEAGRVLARLTPLLGFSHNENREPQITREELLRRKQSKGPSMSTADVLSFLETL